MCYKLICKIKGECHGRTDQACIQGGRLAGQAGCGPGGYAANGVVLDQKVFCSHRVLFPDRGGMQPGGHAPGVVSGLLARALAGAGQWARAACANSAGLNCRAVPLPALPMLHLLRSEKFLLIAALVAAAAFPLEHAVLAAGQAASLVAAVALIGVIMMASLRVAHHAEVLAEKVGEPYGTMILTLAAVLVEVVILA